MTLETLLPWLSGAVTGTAVWLGLRMWSEPNPAPAQLVRIVKGDITKQHVDVIVNAAKSSLLGGGGVDGAIHAAGGPQILAECRATRANRYPDGLPAGRATATSAGDLPAKFVIHTVGPVFSATEDRSALLQSCYTESMRLAASLGAKTVAFPLISAGVYGWPKDDAVQQFRNALLLTPPGLEEVQLVLFDDATFKVATAVMSES